VIYAPDGRTIASGDTEGVLRLWSAETAQELVELSKQPQAISQLAFSPDGRLLAAAMQDGMNRFWAAFP
jgi:WD40 repeat protein